MTIVTNETSTEKGIRLKNYQQMEPKTTSEYLEPVFVVDSILFDMQFRGISIPPQQKYLDNLKDHVKVIILNLYDAYSSDPERYVAYLRRSGGYKTKRGYQGFQFGYQNIRKVTDFLKDYGYIEQEDGYLDRKKGESHLSKMRATAKLIDLIEKQKKVTPDMIKRDTSHEEVIIVKGVKPKKRWREVIEDGKKKKKKYQPPRKICKTPDNGKVRKMRENLKLINSVMEKADITLDITDQELKELNYRLTLSRNPYKQPVDFSRKTLHRVFLDRRLDKGGRFYGPWYQNIYKEYRSKIMIDDLVTLEFDFSGYHINLLYALEGLTLPEEDPYKLDGFSDAKETRDFFKRVLLVVLNTKRDTITKAKDAVIRRIVRDVRFGELIQPEEIQDINAAIDQFAIKHEPIQKYFFTGYGIDLQYIDSQIAEKILLYFATTVEAPCLPVHDSFIIHSGLVFKLQEIMLHYFEREFTQKIPITYDMDEVLHRQGKKYRERYHEEKKLSENFGTND
jgi:hypothetical protein